MIKRRTALILILSFIALFTAAAKSEVWVGADFSYDVNYLSAYSRPYYQGENTYGDVSSLSNIKSIGPSLDMIIFPSEKVRVGIIASASSFFTVGYNSTSYKSYNFDNKLDFNLGLAYNQMFSKSLGMYTNIKMNTSLNQIATTNKNNSRDDVTYNRYFDFGAGIDIGLLAKKKNSFFKLGASYVHSFKAPLAEGFSIQMSIGGGFIF